MNLFLAQIFLAYGAEYGIYYAIAATAVSAAGTAYSYYNSQQQAKKVEQQGAMNSAAIGAEQQRQAAIDLENTKRKAVEQQRFRANQNNNLANSGFDTTTGTPLAIMADTITAQQREISDAGYAQDTKQSQLGWQGTQALYGANQQSQSIATQGTANLISGVGNTGYQAFTVSQSSGRTAKSNPYGNAVN